MEGKDIREDMSELFEELTEIKGIGPAKADKILKIVEADSSVGGPKLEKAKQAAREEDDRECRIWLQRWMNE